MKKEGSKLLSNKDLAKMYICRRCLNEYAKIKYKNYELRYKYYYYHFKCAKCGGMHHIVKNVKFMYRWKLWFTQKPNLDTEEALDPQIEKALKRNQKKLKLKKWFHW